MPLTLIQKTRIDKVEVEEKILELLREFEEKTGFEVDYLNFERQESMGELERHLVSLNMSCTFK